MKNKGTLPVISAGILWGIISIFIRTISKFGYDSFQIMFFRAWLGAIAMFIFFLIFKREYLKISLKDIWMFIGSGIVSLTAFSYCYFTTIINCGAAVAVVLLYTSPIFVMLLSALIFKEKITKRKIIALIMTFAGCVLVAGLMGGGISLSIGSFMLGLGAGLGYALYSIFAGFAVKKYSSLTITFYTFLFSGIALLFIENPYALCTNMDIRVLPSLLGVSIICAVFPYILYTIGLKHMEKSKAAVLVTVEPLVGTLLGLIAYHEDANVFKIIGIILILISVVALAKE